MEVLTSPKNWSHLPRDCGANKWSSHPKNVEEPIDN